MYKLLTTLLICLGMMSTPVFAGAGHDHGHGHSHGPISADSAAKKAGKRINYLASKGKIDASWTGIKPASVEKKTFKGQPEWVVTFKNSKVTDPKKQTLYVFFTLNGRYLATNYTGQ